MPVKFVVKKDLEIYTNPDEPEIDHDEFAAGITFFNQYYSCSIAGSSFPNPIIVRWADFVAIVVFPALEHIAIKDLALRFYHMFDTDLKEWYLTVTTCKMDTQPVSGSTNKYAITQMGNWYNLKNGKIISISSEPPLANDPSRKYFTQILYNYPVPTPLSHTDHVSSLNFPWKNELLAMYTGCNEHVPFTSDVFMVFNGFSIDNGTTLPTPTSRVRWPHGVAIYLMEHGIPRIGMGNFGSIFANKAADFATMCPPNTNCDYCILPNGVIRVE